MRHISTSEVIMAETCNVLPALQVCCSPSMWRVPAPLLRVLQDPRPPLPDRQVRVSQSFNSIAAYLAQITAACEGYSVCSFVHLLAECLHRCTTNPAAVAAGISEVMVHGHAATWSILNPLRRRHLDFHRPRLRGCRLRPAGHLFHFHCARAVL